MSKPVSGLNVFQNQAGPIPLSQLDANFTLQSNALNDTGTYSNYFADSSGAANTVTVTVGAPLTFAYVTGISLQVKFANTNTSATVNLNVNALGNKPIINNDGTALLIGQLTANSILDLMYDGVSFRLLSRSSTAIVPTGLFPDGTVGAPSISFASDTNTGVYRIASDQLAIAAGGAFASAFINTASVLQQVSADGTVALPFYSFSNDPDTGVYRVNNNQLAFAAGGIFASAFINTAGVMQQVSADGSAAQPFYAFSSDPDTGIYRSAANVMRLATGGADALVLTTTEIAIGASHVIGAIDGLVGTPSYSFDSDLDTGMYRAAANFPAIAGGGANVAAWDQPGNRFLQYLLQQNVLDGSAASPVYSWNNDTDTGFYRDTANQIAIALGGATAGQIAQGSYTGTLTGCTTSPTATISYQRVGNLVILNIPISGVTGTSNSNAFTITGAPAIIRPTNTTGLITACGDITNNGADENSVVHLVSMNPTGTLTFYRSSASPSTWTAAGTKGIGALGMTIFYLIG